MSAQPFLDEAMIEPPKFKVANLIADDDFLTVIGEITIEEEGGIDRLNSL